MSEAQTIRELADRQAIAELIYRYCRAMDRMDRALGYSIWHDDAVADYGADVYQGSGRGFIDAVCDMHLDALGHSHQITNILIRLDGDRAGSESYITSTLRMIRDGKTVQATTWNRYIDTWSRRGGRWGIEKRVTLIDLSEIREVVAMALEARGSRDRNDPSYAVLGDPS